MELVSISQAICLGYMAGRFQKYEYEIKQIATIVDNFFMEKGSNNVEK